MAGAFNLLLGLEYGHHIEMGFSLDGQRPAGTKEATAVIKQYAKQSVKEDDQTRFVEVVETELMSLHEGNIARYRLRPAEYSGMAGNLAMTGI